MSLTDVNDNFSAPVLKENLYQNLKVMKTICEHDIKRRVQSLQSELHLAEKELREQLDKMCTEMTDTIGESEGLQLRDIRFLARELSSSSSSSYPVSNILGYLSVDGLLPSHLSLSLSSKLTDLKPGGSVLMTVEPDTDREVTAGWDKKVGILVTFTSSEGRQEILTLEEKTEGGKRLLKFETALAGMYRVAVTLYEQHVGNSPFVIPVGENLLESIGLCHLEEEDPEMEMIKIENSVPKFSPGQIVLVSRKGQGKGGHQAKVVREAVNDFYVVEYIDRGDFAMFSFEDISPVDVISSRVGEELLVPLQEEEEVTNDVGEYQAACSDISSSEDSCLSSFESDEEERINEPIPIKPEPVPESTKMTCCVCLNTARKAMALICDGSIVCWNCAVQGNSPALQTETAVADDFTFTALLQQDPKGGRVIPVLHNLQLTDLDAAVTMLEVLADGSFISLIGQTLIKFSRDGKRLGEVKEKIPPRNVLVRKNGEILSFNENGIKLYDNDLMLLREIKRPLTDCYGLAEDSDGHLVTVNTNTRGGQITQQGTSSILVIDVGQGLVRRVIDLGDVIEASTDNKPPIDFIAFKNGFFYVVDSRLCCVYVISENGLTASKFGAEGRAEGQFRGPNSLVLDGAGNMIVCDGLNYRLQVFSPSHEFLGFVKVDKSLSRPKLLFLDETRKELYVFNKWNRNVIRYKM